MTKMTDTEGAEVPLDDDGCTLYSLHFNDERLGWFDSFEECQMRAEAHKAEQGK